MLNELMAIVLVSVLFIACKPSNSNGELNEMRVVYSEEQRKNMELDFKIFINDISTCIEENTSFSDLHMFISDDFYLENEYNKNFNPNDPNTSIFYYKKNMKYLEIISNQLDVKILKYLFLKGDVSVFPPIASILNNSRKIVDSQKFPALDFKYNKNKKKWELTAIRFLRP